MPMAPVHCEATPRKQSTHIREDPFPTVGWAIVRRPLDLTGLNIVVVEANFFSWAYVTRCCEPDEQLFCVDVRGRITLVGARRSMVDIARPAGAIGVLRINVRDLTCVTSARLQREAVVAAVLLAIHGCALPQAAQTTTTLAESLKLGSIGDDRPLAARPSMAQLKVSYRQVLAPVHTYHRAHGNVAGGKYTLALLRVAAFPNIHAALSGTPWPIGRLAKRTRWCGCILWPTLGNHSFDYSLSFDARHISRVARCVQTLQRAVNMFATIFAWTSFTLPASDKMTAVSTGFRPERSRAFQAYFSAASMSDVSSPRGAQPNKVAMSLGPCEGAAACPAERSCGA